MKYVYMNIFSYKGGKDSKDCIDIMRNMYEKFFKKLKINYLLFKNINYSIIIKIESFKNFKFLKLEEGVHKIIRYSPYKNNSVQTSYCYIKIYFNNEIKEKDILFKRKDLKIDTFKSSGAGGQHVNKTNSAVRITHIPTNITVECQKERSQHVNKKNALEMLKYKIKNTNKEKVKYKIKNKIIRIYYFTKSLVIDKVYNKKIPINKIMKGFINKVYFN
ncbi:peptide chain release factor-like protein [Candidatus Vidania fulgoroideorum]